MSAPPPTIAHKLSAVNEQTWLSLGSLAELMADWDRAMASYESALRHNPYSVSALSHIASLCRGREEFPKAVDYFKRILTIQDNHGETWIALGHCYLMMDNLQEAYQAYQQALYHLPNPKDPKLWYGIGILYDRYGSLEHAEEAFSAVMKMDPKFEKANEIYFRLGIIYKQQQKYDLSLQCFRYILHNPPRPLTEIDIWFQTGHVYEQQKEYEHAKDVYERVLADNPDHAKVLQQLGWLFHQQNTSFTNQAMAIQFLTRSLKADSNDAQSWYLLGRCYMAEQNYNKAYEAYQQAVYRDARNPTFWCSIGVLYYQINQYRDALDAYSRAIRLNPYISEVWYDLGTLYESCNNQVKDAMDAYQRASELDPNNPHIKQRLEWLRKSQTGYSTPLAPHNLIPQDVNPYQYQTAPQALYTSLGSQPGHYSASHQALDRRMPAIVDPPRDLPMPDRSPVNQYQRHDDVRIPDIGSGGGRAPTPSERVQMNPLMIDPRPHSRQPHKPLPSHSSHPSPLPSHSPSPVKPFTVRPSTPSSSSHSPRPYYSRHYDTEPLRRTSIIYDADRYEYDRRNARPDPRPKMPELHHHNSRSPPSPADDHRKRFEKPRRTPPILNGHPLESPRQSPHRPVDPPLEDLKMVPMKRAVEDEKPSQSPLPDRQQDKRVALSS